MPDGRCTMRCLCEEGRGKEQHYHCPYPGCTHTRVRPVKLVGHYKECHMPCEVSLTASE